MSVTLASRQWSVKICFGFFWGDFCHSSPYLGLSMRLEIVEPPKPYTARANSFFRCRSSQVRPNRSASLWRIGATDPPLRFPPHASEDDAPQRTTGLESAMSLALTMPFIAPYGFSSSSFLNSWRRSRNFSSSSRVAAVAPGRVLMMWAVRRTISSVSWVL